MCVVRYCILHVSTYVRIRDCSYAAICVQLLVCVYLCICTYVRNYVLVQQTTVHYYRLCDCSEGEACLMKEGGPDVVQVTEQREDTPLLLVVPQLNESGMECGECDVCGECGDCEVCEVCGVWGG